MKNRFTIYKSKFFYLLLLLVIYSLSTSLVKGNNHIHLLIGGLFTFIILFCVYIIPHEIRLLIFTISLGSISLVCHWIISINQPTEFLYIVFSIANIFFLLIITYAVLINVTKQKEITADTLFGAINGYFLLGFTWSFIYLLVAVINPDAFTKNLFGLSIHDCQQNFFYFSFTTMTTLGYGDILPASHLARTCAWLEAITGQIYLAVWISQLVGLRIAQKNPAHPPLSAKTPS